MTERLLSAKQSTNLFKFNLQNFDTINLTDHDYISIENNKRQLKKKKIFYIQLFVEYFII